MERPSCECHGEPMHLQGYKTSGERKYQCAVKKREHYNRRYREEPGFAATRRMEIRRVYYYGGGREKKIKRYRELVSAGLCGKCGKPVLTTALCWDCLNYMEARRAINL